MVDTLSGQIDTTNPKPDAAAIVVRPIGGGGFDTVNQGSPNTNANAWPVKLEDESGTPIGTPTNPLVVATDVAAQNLVDYSSNDAGDGTVALGSGDTDLLSIPVASGKLLITGWNFSADKHAAVTLAVYDGLVPVLTRTIRATTVLGDGEMAFATPVPVDGAVDRAVKVIARRLSGSGGSAACGLTGYTQ